MHYMLGALLVATAVMASVAVLPKGSAAYGNVAPSEAPSGMVTFTLTTPPDLAAEDGPVLVELVCDDQRLAAAEFTDTERVPVTVPVDDITGACHVDASWPMREAVRHEATITVSLDGEAVERGLRYSADGRSTSREFELLADSSPAEFAIDLTLGATPANEVGTALRVMAFNIWLGGTLDPAHGAGMGERNLDELLEFVRHEDPDVLFLVETYGAGERVEQALNQDRTDGREFTGVQVTREPGQDPDRDNLWLYTWLPVEEIYDRVSGGGVTSFHFGGARLGLPTGGHVHAFTTWLHHLDNARVYTNNAAAEEFLGLCRSNSDEEILATDERTRLGQAGTILEERLREYTGDDGAPVIIGGDFNTLSHQDWSERFAGAPGHGGLVLDWPVTRMFTEAGFTDTYRWTYPDAARYPGSTMDPARGQIVVPGRIDYVLTRGDDVRVLGSAIRTERLPEHRGTDLDDRFPFYSDHAAVLTDVLIRGTGEGQDPGRQPLAEVPVDADAEWPGEPDGARIPAHDLTAVASTEDEFRGAGRAVDGDLRTHWHSDTDPVTDLPHEITIDMQRVRNLSALRYQPRFDSSIGTILRATLQASHDGSSFTDVAVVEWDRTRFPKDVDLAGVTARYLRLTVEHSSGGDLSSAVELVPYEARRTGPPPHAPARGRHRTEGTQDVVVTTQTLGSDCMPLYHESGSWTSSNLSGHDGSPTRYSNVSGSTATWTPELPADGDYEVAIWWPDHPTTTRSARYTINGSGAPAEVTIDPVEGMGTWTVLGRWAFEAGTDGDVTLTVGSGYHRADAIRFRPVDGRDGP
ncbi:hypothetical protein G1H11_04105 [Phytoactinopolyspora alkaliphila]|uniref:F5/8 type C domain-containing protein n=1 Tax=Phytoactinopolyspora alkaliphila TaxID=1783498 RepID=A0A6N9YHW6_9ACTN|nr:discoidin domain-containing protein [Phytoactinopolyspora alkaliphila]NED94488.1 hypothetical protein [Phytoactinopolyspora alkaliphila]